MIGTAIILIPPLVIIMLVLMTRQDSTWCGDYLIYEKFHFTATLKRIGKAIHHLFYEEGELAGGLYHINLFSHIRHA